MTRRTYTHQRTNNDRRQHNVGTDMEDNRYDGDRYLDTLLDRLDHMEDRIDQQHSSHPEHGTDSHSGEKLTFTLPQIFSWVFGIVTVGGSLLAAWVNLNNQITSQKVSTDLTIAQIQKDMSQQETINKELHSKIDNTVILLQGSIDKLTNRIEDLDNTVSQLYNRTLSPKK